VSEAGRINQSAMNEKPREASRGEGGAVVSVDEHLIGHVAVGLTSGAPGVRWGQQLAVR